MKPVNYQAQPILKDDMFAPLLEYLQSVDLEQRFVVFKLPYDIKFNLASAVRFICPGNKLEHADYYIISGTVIDDNLLMYFYQTRQQV